MSRKALSNRENWPELRAIALAAVTETPGLTAYRVSQVIPVPVAGPGEFQPRFTPITLALDLLKDLTEAGELRVEPDPRGQRWYPAAGEEGEYAGG